MKLTDEEKAIEIKAHELIIADKGGAKANELTLLIQAFVALVTPQSILGMIKRIKRAGWQPIETASKDDLLWLWVPDEDRLLAGFWHEAGQHWMSELTRRKIHPTMWHLYKPNAPEV